MEISPRVPILMKYSNDAIADAIAKSKSWIEVCRILGITPASGSQSHMARRARAAGMDWSHFTGRPERRTSGRRPIEDYFANAVFINSHELKKKLIGAGMKEEKCESCGGVYWMGEPIPLELDHQDGNHWNNAFENLRVLCPNCHALKTRKQSRGEGSIPHHRGARIQPQQPKQCKCGRLIQRRSKTCMYCRPAGSRRRKILWPNDQELLDSISNSSVLAISRKLGVSDNAVRKHLHRIAKRRSGLTANQAISGFDDRPVLQVL